MSRVDTIVIGGGIVGLSCAYFLSLRGQKVLLIERDTFDTGASVGNAGLVAFGHAPMPRPGAIRQSFKMFLDPLNPLYVKPRLDLSMLRWFLDFKKACDPEPFARSMKILSELGFEAKQCFEQIVSNEMVNGEYRKTGWIDLCLSEERLEQAFEEADLVSSHGYKVDKLTGDEIRANDPSILDEIVGGTHYTQSVILDPGRFTTEFAACLRDRGVRTRTQIDIKKILTKDGKVVGVRTAGAETLEADNVVLAAGIWSTKLAQTVGLNLPMQAGKGYHVNLSAPNPLPRFGYVCAEAFVAATPMNGNLRLAGTIEFSGINDTMNTRRLNMLQAGARKYFKGIGTCQSLSTWNGLRPCTADGLPIVGESSQVQGLFVATGHAMMGFTLGPVTGKLISECIVDGKPSMDISALSPDRYTP
ncbi:MAG: FAD-binding oxidoreductase [Planctomycetota bacterium]|nr:FAD-binding oxidoreductase [Planctomycetota bacterium]